MDLLNYCPKSEKLCHRQITDQHRVFKLENSSVSLSLKGWKKLQVNFVGVLEFVILKATIHFTRRKDMKFQFKWKQFTFRPLIWLHCTITQKHPSRIYTRFAFSYSFSLLSRYLNRLGVQLLEYLATSKLNAHKFQSHFESF